ncbi:MAG: anaerobic ribonucleoside-triphosphate reductase activating protein [Bacteroidales bacterium]
MNYHNITKCDMLNGEGLRVVLWVSHCIHNCPGCHNPQTHDANSGIPFDQPALDELLDELGKDYISGITFSGGDPLSPLNRRTILDLCTRIQRDFPEKNIWLYTGFHWEEICNLEGMDKVDVVVDGPFLCGQRDNSLPYRGSANQRVIDVKASFSSNRVIVKY